MITKVLEYIKRYHMIEAGDTIVAGISGGADSVCLLFMLLALKEKIPFSLAAVHVNHRIREEAGEDAAYVKALCEENELPFYLFEEDVKALAAELKLSEEEAGRKIRYQAFEQALAIEMEKKSAGNGRIAVAHNSNDRAETVLFHLFRGTGLPGAAGIRPVNGRVIRPLLGVERAEIEAWLKEQGIAYRTDATNEQDIYTRNRIRHHILSYAEEHVCTGAAGHVSRAGELFQAADEFIGRQTLLARSRCTAAPDKGGKGEIRIDLPAFWKEDDYLQGCILLSCLEEITEKRKDITGAHIKSILQLFKAGGSRELHLPYGLVVYKEYDVGIIVKEGGFCSLKNSQMLCGYSVPIPGTVQIPGLGCVEITVFPYKKIENIPQKTYTKWFDYDKITKSILFRTRKAGDYLTINQKEDRKSLQDYFVNEKIPKAERDCFYVLADGAHVMWVPGHRISEHYKVSEDTRTILQIKVCERERSL